MKAGPSDCMECRIQKAHTALDMGTLYPSLAPLPLSVSGNATRHKEKAYGRVLKTRVSEVCRQTVLRGSPRVTDGVMDRMMRMILPFRLTFSGIDGTWKLNQNKPAEARLAAADALEARGGEPDTTALARLMRQAG